MAGIRMRLVWALQLQLLLLLLLATGPCLPATQASEDPRVKRSDDVDVSALESLVQQQAQVVQTLQSRLTAAEHTVNTLQTRLADVERRAAANSKAVAFSVRFSNATDQGVNDGVAIGAGSTLKFDAIVSNVGGGYSSDTGTFTAPVSGVYSFFLNIMATNHHGDIWIDIKKHGTTLDTLYAEGSADIYDQGSSQVAAHLAAGEKVWVQQHYGDAVRGDWWTIFTGYLVQAD